MASVLIAYTGQYVRNATGGTADGAKLYVYDAQTEDLASIFVDASQDTAADNPVVADAAGLLPFRWKGVGDYKVILKTSAGVTLDEQDNIPGAVEDVTGVSDYARPQTPVSVKTADYTTISADLGSVINCNTTGGDVELTLLSAVTAGDGKGMTVRHIGSANFAKLVTSSAQTITHPGMGTVTAFSLIGYGESVELVSDGANWHVKSYAPPLMTPNGPGVIKIADRLSAPPVSPTPGATYLLTTSPSGDWSTYAEGDLVRANGQTSGWIKYTPPPDCGWLAYVQDEDRFYAFKGSAWVALASEPATQTEMEAASSTEKTVTPGRQHYHPGHPKFWLMATVSGNVPSLQSSYNVTSITDEGTGQLGVSIATDFSSANWCCLITTQRDTTSLASNSNVQVSQVRNGTQAAGGVSIDCLQINTGSDSVAVHDPAAWHVMGLGDQ